MFMENGCVCLKYEHKRKELQKRCLQEFNYLQEFTNTSYLPVRNIGKFLCTLMKYSLPVQNIVKFL